MGTIFINSKNCKTSNPHRLLVNLPSQTIPSVRIYLKNIGKRVTFIIKTAYYLELLIPETTKLLGSTKIKINGNKNGENVPNLEIIEVLLVHCNIVNNDYLQDSRV